MSLSMPKDAGAFGEALGRFLVYAVSLICCALGAVELWGPGAGLFVAGVHLLIGLKVGRR